MIEKFFVTKGSKRTKEVRPFPNIRFHGIEFKKCTPFSLGQWCLHAVFSGVSQPIVQSGTGNGKGECRNSWGDPWNIRGSSCKCRKSNWVSIQTVKQLLFSIFHWFDIVWSNNEFVSWFQRGTYPRKICKRRTSHKLSNCHISWKHFGKCNGKDSSGVSRCRFWRGPEFKTRTQRCGRL